MSPCSNIGFFGEKNDINVNYKVLQTNFVITTGYITEDVLLTILF